MASCKQLDELDRILECPICLERIVEPRILHCLHSFCQKCLGQHMEEKQENGFFPCPMCNTGIAVPKDGKTGFKQNFFLREISDLFLQGSELKCDICKVSRYNVDATSMCLQCRDHLCEECAKFHCRTKLTANHTLVRLDEVRRGQHFDELKSTKYVYCSIHGNKVLDICCIECIKPVCSQCTITEHKQHEMQAINEAANIADQDIRTLLHPWIAAAKHCEKLCEQRKNIFDGIEQQGNDRATQVKHIYKSIKDKFLQRIEREETTALATLEQEVKMAMKQAEVACSEAELNRVTVNSAVQYAQNILDSAEDVEKLQHFNDIKTRLDSRHLRNIEFQTSTPQFVLDPNDIKLPDYPLSVVAKVTHGNQAVLSHFMQQRYKLRGQPALLKCFSKHMAYEKESKRLGFFINDDWLITTDAGNVKVKVFNQVSEALMLVMEKENYRLQNPVDVTCNHQKEIFVVDKKLRGVIKFNGKGIVEKILPDLIPGTGRIACVDESLVLTDKQGGRLLITDFDLNIRKVVDRASLGLGLFSPYYVCGDNEGHLVVSDRDKKCVYVIDPAVPTVLQTYSDQLIRMPHDVCVDLLGNILVAEWEHSRVLMIDTRGNVSICINYYHITKPIGLAVTQLGEVAVLEWWTGEVKFFKYLDQV